MDNGNKQYVIAKEDGKYLGTGYLQWVDDIQLAYKYDDIDTADAVSRWLSGIGTDVIVEMVG